MSIQVAELSRLNFGELLVYIDVVLEQIQVLYPWTSFLILCITRYVRVDAAGTSVDVELLGKEWMLEVNSPPPLLDEIFSRWEYPTQELVNLTSAMALSLPNDTNIDREQRVSSTHKVPLTGSPCFRQLVNHTRRLSSLYIPVRFGPKIAIPRKFAS